MTIEATTWPRLSAAIVSTDLEPNTLERLAAAVKGYFWDNVAILGDVPLVEWDDTEDGAEFRLTDALRGRRYVVLDERVGDRSAFELLALLKATPEAKGMMFALLVSTPDERTLYAAWVSGFDICLAKPVDEDDLRSRSTHAFLAIKNRDEDPAQWTPRLEKHRKEFVMAPLDVGFTAQVYLATAAHARDEADRLGHQATDTEHVLLGLLHEANNATRLLRSLGVDPETVREEIERRLSPGTWTPRHEEWQVAPRTHRVLELAMEEAGKQGEKKAGTQHVLWALLQLGEGVAAEALNGRGIDSERLRAALASPTFEATDERVQRHDPEPEES